MEECQGGIRRPAPAGAVMAGARRCPPPSLSSVCAALAFLVVGATTAKADTAAGPESPPRARSVHGTPDFVLTLSGNARAIETRLDEIESLLAELPDPPSGPKGGALGFHSTQSLDPRTPSWITIDLGQVRAIDAIALVPSSAVNHAGSSGADAYGFPPAFRIEIADDPDAFDEARVAFEQAEGDNSRGATFPTVIDLGGIEGRCVRVTATERWRSPAAPRYHFSIGEILVFVDGRNVAPWKPVHTNGTIDSLPLWHAANAVDGQSALGNPVAREPSPTNGFHSAIMSRPDRETWVEIDLGELVPISEIRLVPARPVDFAEFPGFGFPPAFRVECAKEPGFGDVKIVFQRVEPPFTNPGDNPVPIPLDDVQARFVRVTATRLWQRQDDFVFALAELQVFSGGRNVALGAPVESSDGFESGYWSDRWLVDGYDSQLRLVDDELDWLRGLATRGKLAAEASLLRDSLQDQIDATTRLLTRTALWMGALLAALVAFVTLRIRLARVRELAGLRRRIASDLHDEIGSNLGSIVLLSEAPSFGGEGDLHEINRIARETGESMRDIVWVIEGGHDTLGDLVARIREVAAVMLRHHACSLTTSPDFASGRRVRLAFKRNVLLFVKEALHNIVRHSRATEVTVTFRTDSGRLVIDVRDNGCGFDPANPAHHHGAGLKSLRHRAEELRGNFVIDSAPDAGATLTLDVPID